ncbi:hypothetical protein ACRALDRAFT_1025853 [Sodiomyces alcalophilus JCM 7366]|uniref:uncharacterized protein n=1 Tax=Sodiomyces alcalophilus JCM 7366 TaxID=591952 RepID=UPI0039B55F97
MTITSTNLCDLFAQAVARCPDNLAVDHHEGRLTYRELDEASSAVARDLVHLGVGKGSPVPLVTSHGSLNIIAILAILKSGGSFVPIDRRTWSPEMINYVCDTVEGPVMVNTTPEPFITSDLRHVLHLTKVPQVFPETNQSFAATVPQVEADGTACIIFTSGSTGRPKGVMISHMSLCLYAKTSPVNLDISPGDRLLHMLSVAFDACACMLFSTLGNCGTVVPAQAEEILHRASSCTVMAATPSLLSNLPTPSEDSDGIFSSMHTIILGGETATPDLLGSWVDAGIRVLAAYGVTETTSMGSIHHVKRDAQTGIINPCLIGCVMEESPIWLVDSNLTSIETSEDCDTMDGEILIGGAGVAQGYYKDEQKTRDNFIDWNGRRVYKTGDYGRWVRGPEGGHGDCVIEFRGRKDRTVKNRGFLVNLDRDVEDGLCRIGELLGVKSVRAVVAEKGIMAVVTPSGVNTSLLLQRAKQSMPSYSIPYRIEAVDDFPLSPNGKVQPLKVLELIAAIDEAKSTPDASDSDEVTTELEGKLDKVLQAAEQVLRGRDEKIRKLRGDDSFTGMGGSSLLAFKLVSVLRRNGLRISTKDLFKCRTFAEMADLASTISPRSTEHATASWTNDPTVKQSLTSLRDQARDMLVLSDADFDVGPLTSLQLELALPTLLDRSRGVNQVKLTYGGTHASMMERAWRTVWREEPVFRTEINLGIGCGAQIVHKKPFRQPGFEVYDSRDEYDKSVEDASMAVGLGCTLDFFVYRQYEADELTVVLTIHHSLMDGVSLKLLLDNIERVAHGWPLPSRTSSIDANIGLIEMQRKRDAEAREFFASYLRDVPPENASTERFSIGAERRKRDGREQSLKTIFFEASAGIEEISAFASRNCVSTACVYYTAWAMAISALENSMTVIIGGVFSNRASLPLPLTDQESIIGPFMSTLPLIFKFDNASESVVSCLQRTMDDLATVGEYAWARSDQVGIGRRMGNLLAMQLPLPDKHSKPPALQADSLENSDFPLSLLVEANGDLRILYDNTQFEEKTIRRIGEHFKHALFGLLHQATVEDCMKINQLQEAVLRQAEQVRDDVSGEQTVKGALERSMDIFSDHPAIEDYHGSRISYGTLDRLTNIIAHHINASLPDARAIAVHGDGTTGWILGLLGIVKAGRVYVPLDPKWPRDRKAAVCNTIGAAALLLPSAKQIYDESAAAVEGMRVLAVDSILASHDEDNGGDNHEPERLPDTASPESDLFVVFTSGTTGTPKGVPITHRSFLALRSNPEATTFAAPGRRIAQFMSPAFDYCNLEIFSALLHGATLVLRDPSDPYAHLSRVNTATITPSVLAVLDVNQFPNLEIVYATGEAVTAAMVSNFAPRTLFYNAYGPAESGICASFTRMIPGDAVTIGSAIDTARMYVLDDEKFHASDRTRGEIYIAGVQVLRDYINAPDQAALRILPDPWHEGERMYRTGDYGSRGRDGRITYMGRMDRQVKIRGFRVELAGVEQAITSGPADEGITQCSVFAANGTLVAYVVFDTGRNAENLEARITRLRNRLGKELLPSWVPQVILPLDEFPRSVNGKIDTRALEAMYATKTSARETPTAPPPQGQESIEAKLTEVWCRVLQLDPDTQLQDSDDFFKLGGHSVLVMLLATRLTALFGVKITARELLPASARSFRGQVNVIRQLLHPMGDDNDNPREEATTTSQNRKVNGQLNNMLSLEEMTELEQQVWFQHQVATSMTAFNIAKVLHLGGRVDVVRLVDSLNAALASDPVLRCNFEEGPDGPRRVLRRPAPTVRQVRGLDMNAEANHCFNLSDEDLIRVHLVGNKTATEGQDDGIYSQMTLVIVTSHVIADLGTLQNLLRLTSMAYSGLTLPLHERPQHLDSVRWKQRPSQEEKAFWMAYLYGHSYHDRKPSLVRSVLTTLPPAATFQGASRTLEFSGRLITTLNALIRQLGITHHQLALGAAALLLQWLSGEDDVVLGAPNANRSSTADREALGQFLDRLPIRVTLTRDVDIPTVLTEVRDSALKALANAIPFSSILAALGFPSGAVHHPLFQCMVTFHPRSAALGNWLQLPDCTVTDSSLFSHGAKFPLMLEWFEMDSDRWSLHIEHETNHVLPATVDKIELALGIILGAMADKCSTADLRARLAILDSMDRQFHDDRSYSGSMDGVVEAIQREMSACLELSNGSMLSPTTSFFSAGADSRAAVALRHRMRKLGFDISLRAIFLAHSPEKLADYVAFTAG